MQKAWGLDAQFGIGICSGFLKHPWTGLRASLCLLTEDLATVWEAGKGAEETAFCQPPIMGITGNSPVYFIILFQSDFLYLGQI